MKLSIKEGLTFYRKVAGRPYKYHVVAILQNEPIPQVVLKHFGRHKQWWHYEVESEEGMQYAFEIGLYYFKNHKKERTNKNDRIDLQEMP